MFEEALDDDPLALRPSTLTALTEFLDEQQDTRNIPHNLSLPSHPSLNRELTFGSTVDSQHFTVESYKKVFKENWQLSQFWYSRDTAERLATALKSVCTASSRIAFLCCPTSYVAFKEIGGAVQLYLFEHDERFSTIAGADFIHYDLNEPLSFTAAEVFQGMMDIVVVDPPFHSEESQKNISSTIEYILRPSGCLVVLTGVKLSPLIDTIYRSPPLPKLHRKNFVIDHDGVGKLATPYGCWVGGGENFADDSVFGTTFDEGPT